MRYFDFIVGKVQDKIYKDEDLSEMMAGHRQSQLEYRHYFNLRLNAMNRLGDLNLNSIEAIQEEYKKCPEKIKRYEEKIKKSTEDIRTEFYNLRIAQLKNYQERLKDIIDINKKLNEAGGLQDKYSKIIESIGYDIVASVVKENRNNPIVEEVFISAMKGEDIYHKYGRYFGGINNDDSWVEMSLNIIYEEVEKAINKDDSIKKSKGNKTPTTKDENAVEDEFDDDISKI